MKLKINSLGNSAIQVQIDEEDYSLADIVHEELLSEKHVKFAGVAPPHPLIKTLVIQVHTDGADANKALKEAVRISQEKVSELLSVAMQTFPDAVRSPRSGIESSPQV
ncbi:MAG: RpoL/Rpb11 RNA polymerase subunit family protein [Nitrososphaerales archaeon]